MYSLIIDYLWMLFDGWHLDDVLLNNPEQGVGLALELLKDVQQGAGPILMELDCGGNLKNVNH